MLAAAYPSRTVTSTIAFRSLSRWVLLRSACNGVSTWARRAATEAMEERDEPACPLNYNIAVYTYLSTVPRGSLARLGAQLSIDELVGLGWPGEGREAQEGHLGQQPGHLRPGARARLVVDDLEDRRDDRLERQPGRRVVARRMLVALLQEDRERDVAVLDSLYGAWSDGVGLDEPDVGDGGVLLQELGECASGFPASLGPARAGEERAGRHRHELLEAELVDRHEGLLLVGEEGVE